MDDEAPTPQRMTDGVLDDVQRRDTASIRGRVRLVKLDSLRSDLVQVLQPYFNADFQTRFRRATELNEALKEAQARHEALSARKAELDRDLAALRQALKTLPQDMEAAQAARREREQTLSRQIPARREAAAHWRQRMADITAQSDALQREKQELVDLLRPIESRLASDRRFRRLLEVEERHQALRSEVESLMCALDVHQPLDVQQAEEDAGRLGCLRESLDEVARCFLMLYRAAREAECDTADLMAEEEQAAADGEAAEASANLETADGEAAEAVPFLLALERSQACVQSVANRAERHRRHVVDGVQPKDDARLQLDAALAALAGEGWLRCSRGANRALSVAMLNLARQM